MQTRLRSLAAVAVAAAVATAVAAAPARAQITNGSLTGPIVNGGVPPGWTVLAGSPDTNDEFNNVGGGTPFATTPSASPNGGTWVGIGADGGFVERFGQTMTGLLVGQQYTVSWFASNFGALTGLGYVGPNAIEMWIGGAAVGAGPTLTLGPGWFAQSVGFTATSTSESLAFQLATGERAYLGIDGISIAAAGTTVPEPTTLVLLATGLGVVVGVARRARRAAVTT